MSSFLIGLDIGTSAAKAVVIDDQGRLLSSALKEYPIHAPQPGWAEQDPADWLSAALWVMREAAAQSGVDPAQVRGIGLTGQMHSLVALDETGEPLRPAMIWPDQRSGPQVRRLSAQIGQAGLALNAGNPLAAGFMLASWEWLRENEPGVVRDTSLLLLPKDWVRLKLTGLPGCEPSDASSTLLFDPHTRAWSLPLLAQAGLSAERLPRVFESAEIAGGLLEPAARSCGLIPGTPVILGCSDVSAQALALGVVRPGAVSVTVGTGGQIFSPLSEPRHDPQLRVHLFCHALPDLWHYEAAILSAGLSLRWLRDELWPESGGYERLADEAAQAQAAADGLFFLPFLAGERTPYMDPALRAAWIGLGLRHGRACMVRAVLEGVVFALRQGLDLLAELGAPPERLIVSGGATRHPLWLRLMADIFQRPLLLSAEPEATARGAALLAGVGCGVFPSVETALSRVNTLAERLVEPNAPAVESYARAYQDWLGWAGQVAGQYKKEIH